MASNKAQISDPHILIKPSERLRRYIKNLKHVENPPMGISNIVFKNKSKNTTEVQHEIKFLLTDKDRYFIKSLKIDYPNEITELPSYTVSTATATDTNSLLSLHDLHWLYQYIRRENEKHSDKIYLHEIISGSEIVLPKNKEVPRNAELDERCKKLKAQQDNRDYYKMTKNVDNTKRRLPEDTIAYQLKQMNRHLIAVFQFILSVAAGFAFGFIGIELVSGNLDFGFRLLLGIMCALIIALAELYFLAKRLNEDLQFESDLENKSKKNKID
ncbi:unnamed protein product [Phaedon cochleariae]|uniref:Transmembrane protein 199 n=1 Tax=Phaedon cochleariae TaxID=80249 RepID=A0A9N9SBP2_PHACE|nr:unnamed protein product [Phaedon cochleariae]